MDLTTIRLSILAQKFQRNLEDYGWLIALKKSLGYLFGLIYFHQVYRIYRISLDTAKLRRDLDEHGFSFRILTSQDEDAMAQIENLVEWLRGELRDRIAGGQFCLVVFHGENVVGFNLISFGRVFIPLVKLDKALRQGDAWSEHISVRKEFRRMGLASQLRYRIFDELQKRGIRRLYGGALRSNLASLKLARSVGFEEIVDIYYRRLLFFQKWQFNRVRD